MPKKKSLKALQLMEPNKRVKCETSIDWLYKNGQFGAKTFHALNSLNCKNTYDILLLEPSELHSLPNVGAKTVAEVMAFTYRYRKLLDDNIISNPKGELSPFEAAMAVINTRFKSNYNDLLSRLSEELNSPIRVIIDFMPGEEPKLSFEEIDDSDSISLDTPKENLTQQQEYQSPLAKKRKVLEIISPDGEVWSEKFAYQTFMKFIETVGIEKVAALNIEAKSGIPLVSKQIFDKTSSKKVSDDWYIFTGIANTDKALIIKKICGFLDLDYEVHNYTMIID